MADDRLEIQTAMDTGGIDDGMVNIKNIITKGMSVLNNSVSGCISAISGIGTAFLNVAETAGKGLFSLGKSAISVGSNFEESMSQVMATMAIDTSTTLADGTNAYELLSETSKKMGSTTKFSASEASDALNYLALAGYDAEKACEALPEVLNLAQAGGMDLARTSDLMTDAMSALGIDGTAENLQHFGDILAKTSSKSNTSVEQLGDALLVCGGQAKMSGLELTEMATMLGIFADNGIKGAEGGTALRNLLKNMYTPTSKAAQAMEQLGISASDAVTGELRPVQDVLMDTMSAMENLNDSEKMQAMSDIFDVQVLASASAALNNSSERFSELSAEIENCDGAMSQMANTMNDNLNGDISGFFSSLEGLGVEVYESLSDSLRYYVQTGTGYIRQLLEAFKSGGFEGLAGAVGDILSQALTEIVLKIPDFFKIAIKIAVSFIQGIASQLPVIREKVAEIMKNFSEIIQEKSPQIIEKSTEIIRQFISGISNASSNLNGIFSAIFSGFLNAVSAILPQISEKSAEIIKVFAEKFINSKKEIIKSAIPIIQGILQGISDALPEILNYGNEILKELINGVVSAIPQLFPIALKIISGLINGLENAINSILEFAPKILNSLINGIISALPEILNLAIKIISVLIDNLSTAIVAILEFAPQILTSLIDGIIAVFPMLIDCAIGILNALISAIIDNLEPILMACVEILMAIVNGITDNLGMLIDTAFKIIQFLIDELIKGDNLQKIITAGVDILLAISDGIIENLGKIIDAVFQIRNKICTELLSPENVANLTKTGLEILVQIIKGLWNFGTKIIEFSAGLFYEIGTAIGETDWESLGKNILNGILSGLTGTEFDTDDYVGNFGEYWVSGFKDIFKIGSPSKVMEEEVGRWLLPGVAVGVAKTSDKTANDINKNLENLSENIKTQQPEINVESPKINVENPDLIRTEIPEIEQSEIKINSPKINISEPEPIKFEIPEQPEIDVESPKISVENPDLIRTEIPEIEQSEIKINSPKINISEPEPIKFETPEIEFSEIPEQPEIDVKSPKTNVENPDLIRTEIPEIEQSEIKINSPKINISEPEPIKFETPEIEFSEIPEQPEINVESPKTNVENPDLIRTEIPEIEQSEIKINSPKINISEPEPIKFETPEIEFSEIPEQPEINVESPKTNVENPDLIRTKIPEIEQSEIKINSPKINISEPEPIKFETPEIEFSEIPEQPEINVKSPKTDAEIFSQQVEILREFSPKNQPFEFADERITQEIQSQIDELTVNLNADNFISRFENLISNIAIAAVPQYSAVFGEMQSVSDNSENDKFVLPESKNNAVPQLKIFIGNDEIKDFIVSSINEANAMSGGVSV